MAICGHQFRAGDESDWVLSTSADFLAGSTTAKQILHELFKKQFVKMKRKNKILQRQDTASPSENRPPPIYRNPKPENEQNAELSIKKISGESNFENFDESQHLNGCPMKWLYNKRLLEKNKKYKVARWCSKRPANAEDMKKDRSSNLRDRTPVEVKIHKINLTEKYTNTGDENFLPTFKHPPMEKLETSSELETHRKKLAAKLNWKLHSEPEDDCQLETSSEISSRHNYLPPRPLLGLKPLLTILLAPQQETTCCSIPNNLKRNSTREEKMEASLSIRSLDLPLFPPETKLRPRTTNTLRWGAKPRLQKKLQVPNQITIKLRQHKSIPAPVPENELKALYNPPAKRVSEKTKQTKSLSSLFYELKDKTNYRNQEDYFEEMIRDLTMDDDQFKIKKFLNFGPNEFSGNKRFREKKSENELVLPTNNEMNLVCGRVRFFEKDSKKMKQEESSRNRGITLPVTDR